MPVTIGIRRQADLNNFPLGELEETTGTPPYYMDEDYLNEAIDMA